MFPLDRTTHNLFNTIKYDCRSTKGHNLRKIMHYYCGKIQISEITTKEISEKSYHPIPVPEMWRLNLVNELLEIRDNNCNLDGWKNDEITNCIVFLCTPSLVFLNVNHLFGLNK